MTDYKKYINALRKCAKEHDNDRTPTFNIRVSDLCRDTANLLEEVEQEPKTGHWIERVERDDWDDYEEVWYECDQCHTDWGGAVNFCPNCGAKMAEGSGEE